MIITRKKDYKAEVLAALSVGPRTATQLARRINGNRIAVSQALRDLREAGLASSSPKNGGRHLVWAKASWEGSW